MPLPARRSITDAEMLLTASVGRYRYSILTATAVTNPCDPKVLPTVATAGSEAVQIDGGRPVEDCTVGKERHGPNLLGARLLQWYMSEGEMLIADSLPPL